MMRSGNPALNEKTFDRYLSVRPGEDRMTIQGTVNKTGMLLMLCILTGAYTWGKYFEEGMQSISILMWVGIIGGLITALIVAFKPKAAPWGAPLYALLEGLALGGISAMYESQFEGIVMNAVGLTIGTLFALLMAYKSGVIKATENFKLGVVAATGGIFFLYLISFILGFFGIEMSFLHDSSPLSIGISCVIVIVAALNLVLDFDFIENASERGAPKYMEWRGAFGLMVTLVWLYLEILRLLAKLNSRR